MKSKSSVPRIDLLFSFAVGLIGAGLNLFPLSLPVAASMVAIRQDLAELDVQDTNPAYDSTDSLPELANSAIGAESDPAVAKSVEATDEFANTIVPIFQQRCVSCHNSIDRQGDFSLQTREDLFSSGYLEPGQPEESIILDVLTAHDDDAPSMPKSGQPLEAAQVAAIGAWIQAGAPWPDNFEIGEPIVADRNWWSLKPMVRPESPEGTAANPIDRFILKTLAEKQLIPSLPASPRVLIRRLYFDLIGLPPTPEEIEAFVAECEQESADASPSAYERLVERLLASPHYGERWARHWLDVVKYADTCGYDKDKLRPNAWPYRDYVIKSFNDDKPYARFVQEQLAGDVLFPGSPDGIVGLGLIAAGPWDFIGHAELPESKIDGKIARHTDRDEMVSNTLNTFCSVTIQCCQCHHHKFDPFTQEHYYNLQSVFAAVDRADRVYDSDPQTDQQRRQFAERLNRARETQRALEAAIAADGGTELVELETSIAELISQTKPRSLEPEFGYHSEIVAQPDTEKWVQIDLGRPVKISKLVLRPCYDDFNQIGAGFGFPIRFIVTHGLTVDEANHLLHDASQQATPNPGLAPYEIAVADCETRFLRITATQLAPRANDFILALAEVQVFDQSGTNLALNAEVSSLDSIEAPVRWRRSNLTDGLWPAAEDEVAATRLVEARQRRRNRLDQILTVDRIADRQRLQQEIQSLESQLASLPKGKLVYAAATHFEPQATFVPTLGRPREIRLLHRGNVSQPLEVSVPGTLPILELSNETVMDDGRFQLPKNCTEGDRRAALAHWITRPDHPLTWRSIVNRLWQYHFGRGLVDTPNDFGRMGKLPTHAELLDWLAVEFRDGGGSMKALHRMIVTSSTYRQASDHNAANAAIDSDNQYLWRMNRRRLEAEEIRDLMLAVSGKLDLKMGGPGYFLFVLEQPQHSPHYQYHKFDPDDSASHRRSIYRFVVRSQPDPYLTTLDCADSSQSTPQRNETLTSLQALALLNNPFSMAMSKHFARHLANRFKTPEEQVDYGFRQLTGRSPTESELADLVLYAQEHGAENLCRVLFNLSEFVFVD